MCYIVYHHIGNRKLSRENLKISEIPKDKCIRGGHHSISGGGGLMYRGFRLGWREPIIYVIIQIRLHLIYVL